MTPEQERELNERSEASTRRISESLGVPYRGFHFDRDGKPIGLGTWALLREDRDYFVLKQTQLWNGYWVSTVWIGLDHGIGFPDSAPPIIFESMVFDRYGHPRSAPMGALQYAYGDNAPDQTVDELRYATEAEAREHHECLVKAWRWRRGPFAALRAWWTGFSWWMQPEDRGLVWQHVVGIFVLWPLWGVVMDLPGWIRLPGGMWLGYIVGRLWGGLWRDRLAAFERHRRHEDRRVSASMKLATAQFKANMERRSRGLPPIPQ